MNHVVLLGWEIDRGRGAGHWMKSANPGFLTTSITHSLCPDCAGKHNT